MITRALFTAVLISSALASAQATRVWISGVGDDANPCSRTAPCQTLAGALPKVAAGGEINVLDPAELGSASITKSISIIGEPVSGLLAPASGATLAINAPGATVRLRNLSLQSNASGVAAVTVVSDTRVHVERCLFTDYTSEITFIGAGALFIDDSRFHGGGANGVVISTTTAQQTLITNSSFANHDIAVLGIGPARVTAVDTEFSTNSVAAIRVGNGAEVNVERVQVVDSALGVDSHDGVIRLSDSQLSGNGTNVHTRGGSVVHSFGNNRLVPDTCAAVAVDAGTTLVGVALAPVPFEGSGLLGAVTWSTTLPAGLGIDGGVLSGAPTEVGPVSGTLTAVDQRGCMATAGFNLDVVCPAITLAPTALTAVETGAAMTPVQFEATGSTSPDTAFAVTGALPIGVTLVDGGLAGVPTEPGTFPFTVSSVDGFGCTASQAVSLTVTAAAGYQPTTLSLSVMTPAYALTSTSIVATLGPVTGMPSGSVSFYEGTTLLGSAPMLATRTATLNVPTFTAQPHVVTAVYSGDATFGGSRAPAYSFDVVLIPTMTGVALQGSSLVASVTSLIDTPTGQVEFTVDGATFAPVPVNGAGNAVISAPTAVGAHTVQARFLANPRFAASESTVLAVNVEADGGGMTSDGGSASDGGTSTSDGGTGGPDTPKSGCGCNQADVGAVLLAALALFRRRARS